MSIKERLSLLKEELKPNDSIFCNDSPKIRKLKLIINDMPEDDKALFLLYVEISNYRKVASLLGVSHTLVFKEIRRIKEKYFSEIIK